MPANADFVLTHADGTSNRVALKVASGVLDSLPAGWSVEHVSSAPPRVAQDGANYQQQSPESGLVLDQQTWDRGFGEAKNIFGSSGSKGRYGYSEGVLAMFEGELIPGYQEDEVDLFVRNGRFENGSIDPWTGMNTTVALAGSGRNGADAMRVTVTANGGTVTDTYQGSVTPLRSRELTLVSYAKRLSGSGTATLRITDSAGSTDDATAINSTEWTLGEVTRTLDAGATTLAWTWVFSVSGDVWDVDDVAVIPTGGASFPSPPQEFKGSGYVAAGRGIYKWDETNDYFACVFLDDTNPITFLRAFSELGTTDVLIAGRGTLDNYLRSTDGATWADPSTNSGNARLADKLAVVRNATGDFALLKTRANYVSLCVDPSDTVNWGGEIQTGSADRSTTNVFEANDTAYVGREDGLYLYDRTINAFRDIEPEANFFADPNNFEAGMARGGALWATGGDQAFWRITPTNWPFHEWKDFTYLLRADAFRGFGGRVSAVTVDRHNVWAALADNLASVSGTFPYTFPITFPTSLSSRIRLMAIRDWRDKDTGQVSTVAHTVSSFGMGGAQQMGRLTTSTQSSLFVFGYASNTDVSISDTNEPRVIRLRIPIDNENPRLNSTRALRTTGDFYSSWIDYNYPEEEKGAVRFTITSRNLQPGSKYWTLYYKTDDDTDDDSTGWTLWGDDGVFDTSPAETKAADLRGPLSYDRVRFKLSFTSDSSTDEPPAVTATVFRSVWNPVEARQYRAATRLSDRRSQQLRRRRQVALRSTDLANLNALRQEPFCVLTDPDNNTVRVKLRYAQQRIAQRVSALRATAPQVTDMLVLEMNEVRTT